MSLVMPAAQSGEPSKESGGGIGQVLRRELEPGTRFRQPGHRPAVGGKRGGGRHRDPAVPLPLPDQNAVKHGEWGERGVLVIS